MSRRALFLYWFLLLAPTLAITVAAGRLLRSERRRLLDQARVAARERAVGLSDTLLAAVRAVESDITAQLRGLDSTDLTDQLLDWERSDPFVRNVFVWHPDEGLRYPVPGRPSTAEEERFVRRFDALFSGRVPWEPAPEERVGGGTVYGGASPPRGKVSVLAGRQVKAALPGRGDTAGWIPWFSENNLHLLGWFEEGSSGLVYGVELEFMVLLSRLVTAFPENPPPEAVYALLDGNGACVHQSGNWPIGAASRQESSVTLAPLLPHWSVAVYRQGGAGQEGMGATLALLSGLLLLAFVAAIVSAGALLTREAYRKARDARQKTSFVSNVSHELKTPLTSIRIYAELLEQRRVRDSAKEREYLRIMVSEAERLTRLVNNVLDFGRLEQGRKTYRPECIDLAGFAREFAATHAVRVSETGMRLTDVRSKSAVPVRADRDALEQATLNLVDNAIKYARAGGEIELAVEVEAGKGCLHVMDRGPGIPPAHQARIFEKFHRVDNSLTAEQPGSGLGLSIARGLMEGLGGEIRCRPRPGGGACFTIVLPAAGDGEDNA